jgi:hypothetical protein
MDIQATAQLLGNVGEFFGAIAVVATLAYLAVQIRQNTNALRSASYEHWNQQSAEFAHFYANHAKELTELEKFDRLEDLSSEQLKYFNGMSTIAANQAMCAFLQHRAGTLDEDVFDSRIGAFLNFLADRPLMQQGFNSFAPQNAPAAYVEYIRSKANWAEPQAE